MRRSEDPDRATISGRDNTTIPRALVIIGGGDLGDPWRAFAGTSIRIADLLSATGARATVRSTVVEAIRVIAREDGPELVVVTPRNARHSRSSEGGAVTTLASYLRSGGELNVLHVTASSFPGVEDWDAIAAPVRMPSLGHPTEKGKGRLGVYGEMYRWMRVARDSDMVATHHYEGCEHVLFWSHEVDGARNIYDAIGRTLFSLGIPDHVILLKNSALNPA
jgi:hypothetical protein